MDNRTIRLSDAIVALGKKRYFGQPYTDHEVSYNTAIEDSIEALSALPAVGGWMPIGENFPHCPVLLSRPDGDGLRHTATTGFNDATGVWRVFRSKGGMEPLPFVPTHYMPLPAPPEIE